MLGWQRWGWISTLTSHWAAVPSLLSFAVALVLCLPDRAMGMGCGPPLLWPRLTAPSPLFSPVNLWKIHKAVEKLGAYEMVRKDL